MYTIEITIPFIAWTLHMLFCNEGGAEYMNTVIHVLLVSAEVYTYHTHTVH